MTQDEKDLIEHCAKAMSIECFGWDKFGNLCADPVVYNPWNPLTNGDDFDAMMAQFEVEIKWEADDNYLTAMIRPHIRCELTISDYPSRVAAMRYAVCQVVAEAGNQ